MGQISKAGIWVDCKQLMNFTREMMKLMNNADRRDFGDKLLSLNLDMVTNFTLAYKRRDEHFVYDKGTEVYNVELKGLKQKYVDMTQAAVESYTALMEFCFQSGCLGALKKQKRRKKHKQFMTAIAKINIGIAKWSASLSKQVVVSVTRRSPD